MFFNRRYYDEYEDFNDSSSNRADYGRLRYSEWGLVFLFVIVPCCVFPFTTKQETLLCNVKQKTCNLITTNRLNMQKSTFFIDPYDVQDVIVQKYYKTIYRKHGPNRKVEQYDVILLGIYDQRKRLFASYSSREQAELCANEIKMKFRAGNNIIEINRY